MLQTQVNYWNLVEQSRHNQAIEAVESMNASTNRMNAEELYRHNRMTEDLGFQDLNERIRHNQVSEAQGWSNIELSKANLALQQASLEETIRTHKANEAINWANIDVAQANANTNRLSANIQGQNVANQYALGKYQNYTNRMNAYSNQQNANSNTSNAKTNIRNSTTQRMQYNLQEADTKVNWFTSIVNTVKGFTR